MGNTLQDQLLRAGVIDKQKAQEANGKRRKKQKLKHKGAASAIEKDNESVRLAQAEKIARDRELNRKKQEEIERKAVAAQIKQLIELNRLSNEDGEARYNFVDGKSVRNIYVTEDMFLQLGRGWLSVVKFEGGYEVVPTGVADKIKERDKAAVIASNNPDVAEEKGDDPYADYKVPDDLMW